MSKISNLRVARDYDYLRCKKCGIFAFPKIYKSHPKIRICDYCNYSPDIVNEVTNKFNSLGSQEYTNEVVEQNPWSFESMTANERSNYLTCSHMILRAKWRKVEYQIKQKELLTKIIVESITK